MTVRTAGLHDAAALQRLAELDSAPPLTGRVFLAERDGVPIAALAVETGAVVADPFQPTADAVHQLRLQRYQIARQSGLMAGWQLGGVLLPRKPLGFGLGSAVAGR